MRLDQFLADLLRRTAEIERRQDGMIKQGTATNVDPKAGTVRIKFGGTDEEPFLSPPIPYAQMAGTLKVHAPPSEGQQMTVISGSGDFRQGLAVPMTWSDKNASPSEKGDENVLTYGPVKITITATGLTASVGGTSISLSEAGITFVAPDFDFSQG